MGAGVYYLCPFFMEVPVNLNFIRLIATLRLEADVPDRYALFGMRPYFEEAFRQAADCRDSSGHCWRVIFELFPRSSYPMTLTCFWAIPTRAS